jgi:hypothetical protein
LENTVCIVIKLEDKSMATGIGLTNYVTECLTAPTET